MRATIPGPISDAWDNARTGGAALLQTSDVLPVERAVTYFVNFAGRIATCCTCERPDAEKIPRRFITRRPRRIVFFIRSMVHRRQTPQCKSFTRVHHARDANPDELMFIVSRVVLIRSFQVVPDARWSFGNVCNVRRNDFNAHSSFACNM